MAMLLGECSFEYHYSNAVIRMLNVLKMWCGKVKHYNMTGIDVKPMDI